MVEFERLEEVRAGIEKVRNGGLATVFTGLFPDVPQWDKFVAFTHHKVHQPPGAIPMMPLEERVINGVVLRNLFYLMVSSPSEDYFPQITEIIDTFSELLGGEVLPVSAFINFIGKEKPIAPHCDMRETVYWQCQGTALWKIYAESPINDHNVGSVRPVAEYLLQPGDVIYVGREVGHSVVTNEPRCAIGFQYKQDNSRFEANHDMMINHYKNIGVEIAEPRY